VNVSPPYALISRGLPAALALLLSLSCTGQVGGGGGGATGPGASNPNVPGSTGTPSGSGATGGGAVGGGAASSGGGVPISVTGPIVSTPSANSRFVRLNHQQWENTVRDLLHLTAPVGLSSAFVAEPLRSAFDTNGGILTVTPDLWSDYQTAAEALAKKVARDPKLLATLTMGAPADPTGKARAFIQTFGLRAFRRPLADAEIGLYVALFNKGPMLFGTADAFADGAELVLAAFFQSPHFLYRAETSDAVVSGRIPLGNYEVASRLSYGLTNTMPDDALLTSAGAGKLQTRDGVLAEARRLLGTPAARQTVSDFHDQLLHMREYEAIKKDAKAAPLFSAGVGADLKSETLSFVQDVIFGQNRGVTDLLTAPYTFANSRIAKLYGLAATTPAAGQPDPFARVELDPTQRAGLLTQVGFLAANAEGQTPNIIIRGVRIARDVLCLNPPPPPDAVPPLPALLPSSTNRQRVADLTKNAPCNACHTTIINPLGYAFENLDGFGGYRTQENNQPIDATGTYTLDGQAVPFTGAVSLIKAMATSRQAHDCYAQHLVEYLYGREVDMNSAADQNLVAQAGARSKNAMTVQDLILNLVATDAFVSRLP
jgi:Protein of unknown function (DUF1592)/Protein of unknown function (DUF1588)/Protein of unknown function (DUF1595)/Protein of unknown function (DUF1587)/Protein of unknown function (DUF1585)